MRYLIFLTVLALGVAANASRVAEIEDYFTERTSNFIKHRYPSRPYTVYVNAETGEDAKNRNKQPSSTQLPYLDVIEDGGDIWSRKDVPLATLITYLDNVTVRVEIDADMTANELNELHNQLFEFLKLSTSSDKLEIKKMNWTANSEAVERRMWLAAAIGIPLILLLAFFLVTRLSIGSLVRGLAGPISEIGRSTQNFAANAMTLAAGKTDNAARASASSAPLQVQDSNYEARKVIKELIAENKELFSNPSGDLIEFFEREGEKSPAAVGALLCEFDRDVLKNIFQFGYGDWWFNAFSAPSQSPSEALEILSRVNSLKIRQQFSQALRKPVSSEIKDLGLILNRLSYPELESLSKEYPMKKVTPLLALLPREKCVRVCKSAYPGEWGGLIGHSDWGVPDLSIAQQIQRKALALRPLRTEQSVENFFVTLEYQRYLDGAHTKDEKDIYKMLPENSPIKAKRVPFYEIFDSPPEVLKEIAVNAALSDWALAMKDCERYESIKIFDQLSERQRYFLRNMITAIKPHQVVLDEKIQAKKRIMALFLEKKAAHEFANKPPAETYSEAA